MIPINCPKCKAKVEREIIELKRGGFLFREHCPENSLHYSHYRVPDFEELNVNKEE